MSETLLAEMPGFEPIESSQFGCDGCAFEAQILGRDNIAGTDCGKVACFEAQFYDGHPLKGTTKPIIWVRKEAT